MSLSEILGIIASTAGRIAVGKKYRYTPYILLAGSVTWAIFGILEKHYLITVYHVVMAIHAIWSQKEWSKD